MCYRLNDNSKNFYSRDYVRGCLIAEDFCFNRILEIIVEISDYTRLEKKFFAERNDSKTLENKC